MQVSSQLPLFSPARLPGNDTPTTALLLLACSVRKLDRPAPALDLYRGVMYQSYRAHVCDGGVPTVLILSAHHGFLEAHAEIAPYDERMTPQRAEQMIQHLHSYLRPKAWPRQVGRVMLAGGREYRRVMHAALAHRYGSALPELRETTGGIGTQRSLLCTFLDGLAPAFRDRIGQHPNGTPLYHQYGWIEARATVSVVYRAAPHLPPRNAQVLALFEGPNGPTAEVVVEELIRGRTKACPRWVGVSNLRPAMTGMQA
ncbi:DUF6884 domain-containing protein [Cupriavidus taiwanensis]|uniref:DUF6884 domain-containing protein n=1 Tax=Cupriavidus taiwanensis TaxID=164546 RepID=A0A375JE43_9BURK|nr:DUF6884 domain-containing protein [Cupriavidus taiwanensis]SPS02841.1 conserved hypothetical protein [Cupriavidus taiwanensis]